MEVKSTPYTHLYGLRDVVDIVQGLRDAIIAHSKTDEQMKQDAIMLSQRLCNITLAEGDKVSAVYEIIDRMLDRYDFVYGINLKNPLNDYVNYRNTFQSFGIWLMEIRAVLEFCFS